MSNWSEDNHQKAKDKFVLKLVHSAEPDKLESRKALMKICWTPLIDNPYPCAWATIPPDDDLPPAA